MLEIPLLIFPDDGPDCEITITETGAEIFAGGI